MMNARTHDHSHTRNAHTDVQINKNSCTYKAIFIQVRSSVGYCQLPILIHVAVQDLLARSVSHN